MYAGLRPLLSGESEPTSRISREHTVVTPVPGLVMIAGGKLTTYRVMAKDAVDAAGHSLGRRRRARPSARLDHRPGAAGRRRRLRGPLQPARPPGPAGRAARRADRPPARPLRRPGRRPARPGRRPSRAGRRRSRAPTTTSRPRSSTPSPTRAPATSTTCSPGVPASRSRPSTAASPPPRPSARLMGAELGWDEARVADEVDHYLRRVEAERQSQLDADRPGGRRGPGQGAEIV